jgi:hypothetical protein
LSLGVIYSIDHLHAAYYARCESATDVGDDDEDDSSENGAVSFASALFDRHDRRRCE